MASHVLVWERESQELVSIGKLNKLHVTCLNANVSRVNMYASTWLCTKTSDLSGLPNVLRIKSRASTMERLEI